MSNRFIYFFIHLVVSFIIGAVIIGVIIFLWYPGILVTATGVGKLLCIIFIINIIIGPFMSFLIYKEDKKTLKLDLFLIIIIQLTALFYGVYSIAKGRPVWIVYSIDRFELIRNNEILLQPNVSVKSEYRIPSWLGPNYIAVKLSTDKKQKEDDMFNAVYGLTLAKQPNQYMPFSEARLNLLQNIQNLDLLQNYNNQDLVVKILSKYPQANAWLPLKANAVDMVVLINKDKAQVVKIVDLRPWH